MILLARVLTEEQKLGAALTLRESAVNHDRDAEI